jgi:metallo-beta-lactamase class B
VLSAHPSLVDILGKAAARTPQHNPFIEADGCRNYAATASKLLDERLAKERGAR